MELGIGMFGDIPFDKSTGKPGNVGQRLNEIIEEVKLMDELGLDVFAIGEHHRPDYAVASPEILLAALATVTKNIKLMSAVTVLSSSEPVNVYQNFSMIDHISGGRAEIGAGRGSFIESFPLFGYDLKDYNELFEEKLDLLIKINKEESVNWSGKLRAPLVNQTVYPRAKNPEGLPIWIAVGGTPQSVVRAAKLGLPMIMAIIGGMPVQFKPLMDYYRDQYKAYGHDVSKMQLGIHTHTFISEDPAVIDGYFHNYKAQMDRVGASRGWPGFTRYQYEAGMSEDGALFIGSPEQVAEKIINSGKMFELTRFIAHMDIGAPEHSLMMESIRLFGEKVVPLVREAL